MWLNFNKKININDYNIKNSKWKYSIFSFLKKWYNNYDYIKIYTSGTINTKKSISIKKEYMINSVEITNYFFKLKKNSKFLLCLYADYIAGKMFLVRAIVLFCKVYCVPPSSNPLKNIYSSFDFSCMVPMQVINSFNKIEKINNILIGGSYLSSFLKKKLINVSSNCYYSYGMTESLGHIAMKKINGKNIDNYYRKFPKLNISVDNRSCLKIFYSKIMNKPIQTNDIVNIIDDNYFEYIGRYDYIINTGGIKINPEKVEKILITFIKKRFLISSIPDEILGEKLILIIEGFPCLIHIKHNFFFKKKKFLKPKKIFFIKKFFETSSGKIKRLFIKNLLLKKIIT